MHFESFTYCLQIIQPTNIALDWIVERKFAYEMVTINTTQINSIDSIDLFF